MACHNFFFKWISVLIKDSSLARNILHRSLNCVAFVTVSISVCTLLLHSLHIHSLSILYDIFWTWLVLLKHFSHLSSSLFILNFLPADKNILSRHGSKTQAVLCFLAYIVVIVENWVTFTWLCETPNTSLCQVLIVERSYKVLSTSSIVLDLELVFRCLEFPFNLTCLKHCLDVFFLEVFLDSNIIASVKRQIDWRAHVRLAISSMLVADCVDALTECSIIII